MGILVCSASNLCLPQTFYRNTSDRSVSLGFQIGKQPRVSVILSKFQVPLLKNVQGVCERHLPPCGSVLSPVRARGAKLQPRIPLHQRL